MVIVAEEVLSGVEIEVQPEGEVLDHLPKQLHEVDEMTE